MADAETWLTAAECARRIGLSVRALRLYERHGLIAPRRTSKQWRLYGADDIARLNEILVLKTLGHSLARIAELLRGRATDLGRTLATQRESLVGVRERAERGLGVIGVLQAKIATGDAVSIEDLVTLAKETIMTDSNDKDAAAWRRYEQARPRTEARIDTAVYADYAGHYQLEGGPFYIVSTRDGRLFTRVVGQSEIEVFPETESSFFMKLLPVQVSFVRDATGAVNNLVHHQNGMEIPAVRVDPALAEKVETELKERIRNRTPLPNSAAIMRRVIEEHVRGEPDYDGMTPALAALAREQAEIIQADLKRAGPLKDIAFRGVGQHGLDVYDVRFDNATMEWGFGLAEDGKIGGLYLRPSP